MQIHGWNWTGVKSRIADTVIMVLVVLWLLMLGAGVAFAQSPTVIVLEGTVITVANCTVQRNGTDTGWGCTAPAGAAQPLTDSAGLIANSVDATKVLAFQLSGISTATTRTWTIPDADITFPTTIASLGANTFTGLQTLNAGLAATTITASSTLAVSGASTFTTGTFSSTLGVTGVTTLAAMTATTGSYSSTLSVSGVASMLAGIEVGNATDTTLSRASAGVIAVEGVELVRVSTAPVLTGTNITGVPAASILAGSFGAGNYTFSAGVATSAGTPSTHGIMIPTGVPAVLTTNLHNNAGALTWGSSPLVTTNTAQSFSAVQTVMGVKIGSDTTYGATYGTIGWSGRANGDTRIFSLHGVIDDLYLAAGTGKGIIFWPNGSTGAAMTVNAGATSVVGKLSVTAPNSSGASVTGLHIRGASGTFYTSLEVGTTGARIISRESNTDTYWTTNTDLYTYTVTAAAGYITLINGTMTFNTVPSGSAGAAISPTARFTIGNTGAVTAPTVYSTTTASAANMHVDTDGTFYRSTSSMRYKSDPQNFNGGLADLLRLQPISFLSNTNLKGPRHLGFTAEALDAAGMYNVVVYDDEGRPDAVQYDRLTTYLVNAIKELTAEIDAIKKAANLPVSVRRVSTPDATSRERAIANAVIAVTERDIKQCEARNEILVAGGRKPIACGSPAPDTRKERQ